MPQKSNEIEIQSPCRSFSLLNLVYSSKKKRDEVRLKSHDACNYDHHHQRPRFNSQKKILLKSSGTGLSVTNQFSTSLLFVFIFFSLKYHLILDFGIVFFFLDKNKKKKLNTNENRMENK